MNTTTTKPAPGDWQNLSDASQAPRYEAIAGMLRHFALDDRVLDVGCGSGVLRGYLPRDCEYTGVEPCAEAADDADLWTDASVIEVSSADDWRSLGRRFTAVVFNESLYYLADPVGVVSRYAGYLRPGGAILFSVWQKPPATRWLLWRRRGNVAVDRAVQAYAQRNAWTVLDERLIDGPGAPWHLWLARPATAPAARGGAA